LAENAFNEFPILVEPGGGFEASYYMKSIRGDKGRENPLCDQSTMALIDDRRKAGPSKNTVNGHRITIQKNSHFLHSE
jgi:hypothetical protein